MASYVYTASGSAADSANVATDKVRIATTNSPIHFVTGFPLTLLTGNITCDTANTTVVGNGTAFLSELEVGNWIGNSAGATAGIVASIDDDENLNLTSVAAIDITDEEFSYSPYGVPPALVTANSSIIPSNTVENSIIVGQGNVVAYLNVSGATPAPFSITELGMPHANTGTSGY